MCKPGATPCPCATEPTRLPRPVKTKRKELYTTLQKDIAAFKERGFTPTFYSEGGVTLAATTFDRSGKVAALATISIRSEKEEFSSGTLGAIRALKRLKPLTKGLTPSTGRTTVPCKVLEEIAPKLAEDALKLIKYGMRLDDLSHYIGILE